jgi:MoaA/NifB/PqqE/SkfB family radical SAM enzyme
MLGTLIRTNGTLLTPERADGLATAGLSELRLGVDGGDAATSSPVWPA